MDLGLRISKVLLTHIADGITAAVKFHPASLQQSLWNSKFMYDGKRIPAHILTYSPQEW